jgi:RNA 3'-phosphate cyclase
LLEIDGSYGEGGGQILRTAISFSTLTKKPIKITNIRANRPNPGIKPQHYISIQSIKELSNAETTGLEIGSPTLTFKPGDFKGGDYKFEIGTAGSITLAFQAIILASLKTKEPVTIKITGGTDVKWSPSWDYFHHVFLCLLQKTGVTVDSKLIKRGYYPKGGGEAAITVHPCKDIQPLKLDNIQEYKDVHGIVNISNLPDHVSTRIKHAAIKTLLKSGLMSSLEVEQTESLSPGTGITLWTETNDTNLGATLLGERGLRSEEIGKNVAMNLLNEIESESTLDVYAFDQLLPYIALAKENGSSSCIVQKISNHAQTNMWLIKKFFDVDFKAKQEEHHIKISIN